MNVEPSENSRTAVEVMARKAVMSDNHMTPIFEDRLNRKDWSDFQDRHRSAWEETEHFEYHYAKPIRRLVDFDENRIATEIGLLKRETRLYYLYDPLIELFWDTWEEEANLHALWKVFKANERKA